MTQHILPNHTKACMCCGTSAPRLARSCKYCGVPQKYWRPLTATEIQIRDETHAAVCALLDKLIAERV